MEFDDEHEEEQEEEDDEDEPHHINFQPQPTTQTAARNGVAAARYRECLKNHAVSSGGHAVDGCGEFMPAADDPLKCAACTCHRNFHRKEHLPYFPVTAVTPPAPAMYPPQFFHHRPPPPPGFFNHRPLALPPAEINDHRNPSSSGGSGKKRFRTKFTAEQKEKMLEFADSVGWKIRKHDEEAVERFCSELQISRQVLKVWMHNNKNTIGRSKLP